MGTDLVFPSLATAGTRDKLARGKGAKEGKAGVGTDKGLLAAKIGWIEVNTGFVIMSEFFNFMIVGGEGGRERRMR
jgi:hypothetical protein